MKPPEENFEDLLNRATELNSHGRFNDADALLNEVMTSHPKRADLAAHHLRLAQGRGDHYEALRRAQSMIRRFPRNPAGYRIGIRAFQSIGRHTEANTVANAALQTFTTQPWPLYSKAQIAADRAAYADAEKFWSKAQKQFPDEPRGWLGAATFLHQTGRLEAAEAALTEALARFPKDERVRVSYAESAEYLKRWDDADQRWSTVRQMFPDSAVARLQHALVPAQNRNPEGTFERLAAIIRNHPRETDARVAYIDLLRRQERLDEAHAYATESVRSFPDSAKLVIACSRIEEARKNADAAIASLQKFLAPRPRADEIYSELAAALSRADRFAEAEAVCEEALKRSPFHPAHHVAYATLAMWQERWAAAYARWTEAAKWAPSSSRVRFGIATAQTMLAEHSNGGTPAQAAGANGAAGPGDVLSDLMMQFESLGGSEHGWGCEFGFVQRRFGAEPVGLMRWSDMPTDRLLEALDSRFEGVGTLEQTEIMPPSERNEHFARDRRFEIITHTFFDVGYTRLDKVAEQTCRRLQFLRRKFLEDLESGGKIFTYKPTPTPDMTVIEHIFSAMRRYGDNTLLFVRPADSAHSAGTVEVLKPGLLIGYIGETASAAAVDVRMPNFASWLQICWNAYRLGKPQAGAEKSAATELFAESETSAA